jgi:hypothetical protein
MCIETQKVMSKYFCSDCWQNSPIQICVEAALAEPVFAIFGTVHHPSAMAAHKEAVATAEFEEHFGLDASRLFTAGYLGLKEAATALVEHGEEAAS